MMLQICSMLNSRFLGANFVDAINAKIANNHPAGINNMKSTPAARATEGCIKIKQNKNA